MAIGSQQIEAPSLVVRNMAVGPSAPPMMPMEARLGTGEAQQR